MLIGKKRKEATATETRAYQKQFHEAKLLECKSWLTGRQTQGSGQELGLVATLFREDHDWQNVQEGPLKYFFQRSLDVYNKPDVLDAFSRIWLKQGRPVAAREADAFRFNILVPADKEAVFLRLSGFQGCFYSPKTLNNQPDARYALIWSKLSHSDLIGLCQKKDLECHVGLVRGRRGLAVRVPTDKYQQVRGIILPGLAPREYLPANFFWN